MIQPPRICPVCGHALCDLESICSHHGTNAEGWGLRNKVACDFFHRGVVLRYVPMAQWERVNYGLLD